MDSGAEIENERVCDVDNTIFAAVGKSVEKSKMTLFWAVKNFPGKKVCVIHVHRPENSYANEKFLTNKLKQQAVKASQEHERKKVLKLLNEYLHILSQKGVQAYKVWIEKEDIEKGIVEIIAQHNIRWLVMGAAVDKCYSKKMAELKSKKAVSVCQQALPFCHIWFICNGYLIHTRGSRKDESEIESSPPLLLLNTDAESEQSVNRSSESIPYKQRSFDFSPPRSTREPMLLQYHANTEEDDDEWDGISRRSSFPCLLNSNLSDKIEVGDLQSTLYLMDETQEVDSLLPSVHKAQGGYHSSSSIILMDVKNQEPATDEAYDRLEQAIMCIKNSKWAAFQESIKRWKAEDDAIEAICKAKEIECLHANDMIQRKELEEMLAREKQELERMRKQQDELMKEIQMVQDQRSILESRIVESNSAVKELEEKIISAVGLLIPLKESRDALQIEHRKAIREVYELRGSVQEEAASFCRQQFLAFSFLDINEATNNFDPSWKMGEGRYGSVYKGLLQHMHVAIKMLPFYGSQYHLEFQHEVEVSCRVRHPNLVTLIGTCPEARSLIYEYLENGSLEDRLTCRNRTPPLPWQTRIRIAADICSALIFLHSNNPPIIHGNLKPTKVLLDGNFVCKLADLEISHLILQDEKLTNTSLKVTSSYMDPEFLETGELAPALDVYSFGIIMLRLLTARPAFGIVKNVKCALENENFSALLDFSAGEWPLAQANLLAHLALLCCETNRLDRPDLAAEAWSVLETIKVSCTASSTSLGSQVQRRIPSHFICPIFQEVMQDPHIAADGFTYEADAIKGWFQSGHNTSPMTNLKLADCNLLPNYALHYAIQQWQQHS